MPLGMATALGIGGRSEADQGVLQGSRVCVCVRVSAVAVSTSPMRQMPEADKVLLPICLGKLPANSGRSPCDGAA